VILVDVISSSKEGRAGLAPIYFFYFFP
jgi:hypothetical protein